MRNEVFINFLHYYSAAATLILHFDWYCTGNYVFCIIQFTLTACVCVCVFVSSIFYYVNTTRVILIIYMYTRIKKIHRYGAVTAEGLYSVKNNSFTSLCTKGSEAHLRNNSEKCERISFYIFYLYLNDYYCCFASSAARIL